MNNASWSWKSKYIKDGKKIKYDIGVIFHIILIIIITGFIVVLGAMVWYHNPPTTNPVEQATQDVILNKSQTTTRSRIII